MATKDLSKLWGKNEKIKTRNWLFYVGKNPIKRFFHYVSESLYMYRSENQTSVKIHTVSHTGIYAFGDLVRRILMRKVVEQGRSEMLRGVIYDIRITERGSTMNDTISKWIEDIYTDNFKCPYCGMMVPENGYGGCDYPHCPYCAKDVQPVTERTK